MRVAVISSTVFVCPPSGYSGLEMLAWQQAKGLATRGHQVALIAPQGSTCPGVEIIPNGPPGGWDEKQAYSQYWGQLLRGWDAVIDNTWQKWSYSLKQEGRLKAPVLSVCHAPINTMFQSLPLVDKPCFVCISQDQADHFKALFSREAKVAYNGVDLDFYRPLGIPRTDRFLFLARFSTIKGPDIAIEACKQAGVGLDLVGDTSITNEPEYLEQCKKMCDGKQIRMVGPMSRSECVYWFSQAHCLIHANERFREPFGLSPVEAMACGCPVIAWDHGAMRETVGTDNSTGYLVNSYQDLVGAVRHAAVWDKTCLDALRSQCRRRAMLFTEERMITRYEELCSEAIATGGW